MIDAALTYLLLFFSLVGFSQFDGSFIENYTHKWEVYLEDTSGNKSLNRIWTDYVEIVELKDKKFLHRVQDLYNPDGSLQSTWINMVEHHNLKPWYFQSITPSGLNIFIEFHQNQVTFATNEHKNLQKDTLVYQGALYDWNLYGLLLCGLHFESQKSFNFPILNPNTLLIDKLKVNISHQEKIKTRTGKWIDTWKVETDKGLIFWLSKNPPYVIQLKLEMNNGNSLIWYSCL